MNETYLIEGMTCSGCTQSVKKALEAVNGVLSADVTLTPPQATITSNIRIEPNTLAKAVAAAGNYRLDTESASHSTSSAIEMESQSETFWQQYKPLLILVSLLLLVSLIVSFGSENRLELGMRTFMAGFFLAFSFFKLLDLRGFASAYAGYDLLASRWLPYAYVYPFIELTLGLAYTSGLYPDIVNTATIVVMGFSSLGVIRSVLNKQEIQCACLGTVFNLPMSTVTIIEDVGMVVMAAWMLAIN